MSEKSIEKYSELTPEESAQIFFTKVDAYKEKGLTEEDATALVTLETIETKNRQELSETEVKKLEKLRKKVDDLEGG